MQKRSTRSLQLAALLAASASAQTITSTIPVCPTASSTTITMPTTVTFCPGPHCNGGASGPMVTGAPHNGVGVQGHFLGDYTSVGADGKTTVLGIHETVYDSLCSTGLVPATWTITEECGCTEAPAPTVMPAGFQTTVVACTVCGPHSSMVTLTQPIPTGPYATQTPTVNQQPAAAAGPAGQAPAAASAGAGAGANAGAVSGPSGASAGAGSGAGADAVAGTVSPAAAGAAPAGQAPGAASAGAGAGADATAQGPSGASAGADLGSDSAAQVDATGASADAGSGSDAAAQVGADGAAASAGAGAGAGASAGTVSPASAAGAAAAPGGMMHVPANGTMPASNGTPPATNPMVSSYVSSATHASIAGFTIFAGAIAALLL